MDMLKLLRQLIRSIGDGYDEQPVPQQRKKTSGRRSTGYSPSRRPPAPKRTAGTRSAARSTAVRHSQQVYGEQGIPSDPMRLYRPVPQEIHRMKLISGYDAETGLRSMESMFYQQGRFMALYTDDYDGAVPCSRSMPVYSNLSDAELRTYFAWRTQYRQGVKPDIHQPYLLLYAYELLNLIGVQSADEGYTRLVRLLLDYGAKNPVLKKSLEKWLPDFAVYYGLPYRLDDVRRAGLITVVRHSGHTAAELLEALDALSKYRISTSKYYLAQPEQTAEIFQTVYRALLQYYAEEKHASLPAYLLGGQKREMHVMFEGAVFYFHGQHADGAYRLNPLCVYHCLNGRWAVERFCSEPHADRIGDFLKGFEAILREETKYRNKLKIPELPQGDAEAIRQAIRGYFAEQARKNAPVITLDAGELDAIRQAAEHTADMLTLPEYLTEPEAHAEDGIPAERTESAQEAPQEDGTLPDLPLSEPAMALLICLLTGESYQPLIDAGQMISVLTEEINEALYDCFGDTVLETDENGNPVLVPDYTAELRQMFDGE